MTPPKYAPTPEELEFARRYRDLPDSEFARLFHAPWCPLEKYSCQCHAAERSRIARETVAPEAP
jgi:hypothetical protein